MVELEAAAEDVAAAELAELVAAARLKVAAEAEVPVAVAEEGGSARARRHTRRREPGWSMLRVGVAPDRVQSKT